jgi:hypothetical protein
VSTPAKLFKPDVARRLGWTNITHVNVAIMRTRRGTAKVPFPAPDGIEGRREWWLTTTIARYERERRKLKGQRITDAQIAQIRKLREANMSMEQIAIEVGVAKASVCRKLNSTTEKE